LFRQLADTRHNV